MIDHSASTIFQKSSGFSRRISALSFSALSSSSTLRAKILGSVNYFGCCSKPAQENVFLKQTPFTRKESVTEPPVTFLIPMSSLFLFSSKCSTASTTISAKNSLYLLIIFEFMDVIAHLSKSSRFSAGVLSPILTEISLILSMQSLRASR